MQLVPDPAVRFGALENGMLYAILENDTPSGAGALWMRFDVGSFHEADDQQGLAHFLEHMAFNGSENVPEGEMVKILERLGLAFGADTNAFTSFDQTVYTLELPNLEEETLDGAFFIFRETAEKLTVTNGAVDRERGIIVSEERARNTPAFRGGVAQMGFLFPDTLIPDRLPIGLMEVVEGETAAQRMRDLYSDYYRPENTFLVFVGDAPADEIEARIQESFADWTSDGTAGRAPDLGTVRNRGLEAGFFHDPDVRTSVSISAVKAAANPSDSAATRYDALLTQIGNQILTRRLIRISETEGAPFFNGQMGFSEQYDVADAATLSLSTTPENWAGALGVGEQELRRAMEFGFTETELQEALANFETAYESAAASAGTRPSVSLAQGLIFGHGEARVFTHPGFDRDWFQSVRSEISKDGVDAAFKAQWDGTEPLLFLMSAEPMESAETAILEAYRASQSVAVTAPEDAGALEFAYTDFGAPGEIAEQSEIADLSISEIRFENGVRLTLKPTDFEADTIRVSVRFGGGQLELPQELPGLDVLMANTFIAGGLGQHSADELRTLTAGKRVSTGFSVSEDAFVLSGATWGQDLDLQLQLLAAYLTDPGLRPEVLSPFHQASDTYYDSLDATPGGIFQRDGARLLRSGDTRFGLPEMEVLLSRTMADMGETLARARTEGGIEIGIVGDVDMADATALVAQTFGALPARETAPPDFAASRMVIFPEGTARPVQLFHQGEANRAMVSVSWPTTDDRDAKVYREILLLERVLSNRLLDRVREADGATYSPSANAYFASAFPGYGYLGVSLDLTPEDTATYFQTVDEIAAGLMEAPVSDDELIRARVPLIESLDEAAESNAYWMGIVSRLAGRPDLIERHRTRQAGFEAITAEDLLRVAREVFAEGRAYRMVILPESTG